MYEDIFVNIPLSDEEYRELQKEMSKDYREELRRRYLEEVREAMRGE